MKNLFYLLISVTCLQLIKAMTEADAIGALEGFGDDCSPKPNEDDYKNIVRNEENVPQSTKCFRLCLMDRMKLLTDDCKLDAEKLTDLVSMIFEDKEQETTEIANICNSKVTCNDKCDGAHDFAMCILNEFKTREWPLPELEKDD